MERPDLTTEDSATATGIDEELGYQGSACDVDRQTKWARLGEDGAVEEEGSDSGPSESSANYVPMHPPEARTAIAILIKSHGTT